MLEKKTTNKIIKLFNLIPDGTEDDYSSFYNKIWVSQESLIKWLESNTLEPQAECQDSRKQIEARVKREAFKIVLKELKGEKEC